MANTTETTMQGNVFSQPIRKLSVDELEMVVGGEDVSEQALVHPKCNGGMDNQGRMS